MGKIKKNSIVYGNHAVGISKPEDMSLAEIVSEMIKTLVKNPRLIDEYVYMEDGIPAKRYKILQNELISREQKYLRFEKLIANSEKKTP